MGAGAAWNNEIQLTFAKWRNDLTRMLRCLETERIKNAIRYKKREEIDQRPVNRYLTQVKLRFTLLALKMTGVDD
jgi:hypothetical protein